MQLLRGKRGTKIKCCLSPLRNYPAQSFGEGVKKGEARQFARELMEPLLGTIQECVDLEEVQDIPKFSLICLILILILRQYAKHHFCSKQLGPKMRKEH